MLLLFIVMKTIHQMFPKRFRKHMLQILEVLLAFEGIPSRLLKEKRLISQFVTVILQYHLSCFLYFSTTSSNNKYAIIKSNPIPIIGPIITTPCLSNCFCVFMFETFLKKFKPELFNLIKVMFHFCLVKFHN